MGAWRISLHIRHHLIKLHQLDKCQLYKHFCRDLAIRLKLYFMMKSDGGFMFRVYMRHRMVEKWRFKGREEENGG